MAAIKLWDRKSSRVSDHVRTSASHQAVLGSKSRKMTISAAFLLSHTWLLLERWQNILLFREQKSCKLWVCQTWLHNQTSSGHCESTRQTCSGKDQCMLTRSKTTVIWKFYSHFDLWTMLGNHWLVSHPKVQPYVLNVKQGHSGYHFRVFGMTRLGIKPTMSQSQGWHSTRRPLSW